MNTGHFVSSSWQLNVVFITGSENKYKVQFVWINQEDDAEVEELILYTDDFMAFKKVIFFLIKEST